MAIIGKIRKRGGLVVTLIALATVGFIAGPEIVKWVNGESGGMPNKVASVDGLDININEFNLRSEQTEQQMRAQSPDGKMSQEQSFQAKLSAFQQIISEKLLYRECNALGISVGTEEYNDMFLGTFISNSVRQMFTDPQTGQYNTQAVRQIMSNPEKLPQDQQAAWATLQKQARDERLNNKYAIILAKSFYMPKAMAKHISDVYDQTADTRYAVLPLASINDNDVKLTDEDYRKFYEEHKNMYYSNMEQREIEFVKFDVQPSPADIKNINDSALAIFNELQTTKDEDMESFVSSSSDNKYDSIFHKRDDRSISLYFPDSILAGKGAGSYIAPRQVANNWVMGKIMAEQSRPDSVKISAIFVYNNKVGSDQIKRTPEQEKAIVDSLYAVIGKNTKLFEENVAKFSDGNKDNFGDQGWITDGMLQEDMFQKIIACPVNGIFVYNIPDEKGHIIVKVTGKTELHPKIRLAQLVIGIRPSDKTISDMRDKANIFLSKAKDLNAMRAQAQRENLNINTSYVSQMDYQLNGTPYAREVISWAYGKKVHKGDVAAEIFELQNIDNFQDMFVVVGLKDIQEPGTLSLATLKDMNPNFEREVKAEKKAQMLLKKANKIAASNKTIEYFAAAAGVQIDTVLGVDFSIPYYGKAGAEMRVIGRIAAAKNTGMLKPIKGFNGVYAVNIDRISKRPVKEDINMIRQQYQSTMIRRMQQMSPIMLLLDKAKIVNNFTQLYGK